MTIVNVSNKILLGVGVYLVVAEETLVELANIVMKSNVVVHVGNLLVTMLT